MNNSCKCGFAANPVFRLFVALCPVAAAASCGVNGLAIGIAMLAVLLVSGLLLAALGKLIAGDARIPASVLVICMETGVVEILLKMWAPVLAEELGIFVPLCAVGAMLCLLPEGCDCPACRGLKSGIAALVMLVILGVLREVIGTGAVFGKTLWQNANAHVLIARFPAGAYILLGILLGIYTAIRNHGKGDAE